jgi:hypothetical protein
MTKLLIATVAALTVAAVLVSMRATAANTVQMCHNGNTIMVSQSAVQAHLKQGDTMGPCNPSPTH